MENHSAAIASQRNQSSLTGTRTAVHKRGKTMAKPVLDKTQLLSRTPYLTSIRRPPGNFAILKLSPAAPPGHRRTVSHGRYQKAAVSVSGQKSPSVELSKGSTRNQLNRTQLVVPSVGAAASTHERGGVGLRIERTLRLGRTPAARTLSPALTKRRRLFELELRQRHCTGPTHPPEELSLLEPEPTVVTRYSRGNRTPAGRIALPKDPLLRTRTFDFSSSCEHSERLSSHLVEDVLFLPTCTLG